LIREAKLEVYFQKQEGGRNGEGWRRKLISNEFVSYLPLRMTREEVAEQMYDHFSRQVIEDGLGPLQSPDLDVGPVEPFEDCKEGASFRLHKNRKYGPGFCSADLPNASKIKGVNYLRKYMPKSWFDQHPEVDRVFTRR
jgi:hypothetical protein